MYHEYPRRIIFIYGIYQHSVGTQIMGIRKYHILASPAGKEIIKSFSLGIDRVHMKQIKESVIGQGAYVRKMMCGRISVHDVPL